MVKIQKISEIEPCLGFTEFDMLKKYRQSFATSVHFTSFKKNGIKTKPLKRMQHRLAFRKIDNAD